MRCRARCDSGGFLSVADYFVTANGHKGKRHRDHATPVASLDTPCTVILYHIVITLQIPIFSCLPDGYIDNAKAEIKIYE